MRIGCISLWGGDVAAFRREIRLAEDLGYELVTVGDSPIGWHDLYVSLSIVAHETRRATLGPMVTAPFIRHPAVNAGAMSSLYELTGGRAALTLGTGASSVNGVGRAAATQVQMREYLLAMRALFNGESIHWDGYTVNPLRHARKVPLYYAALGPKALHMAGEIADGVVLPVGSSLPAVEEKILAVHAGARAAGRDPSMIDLWAFSFCSVRPSRAKALQDITAFLAASGAYALSAPHAFAKVPAPLQERVRELQSRYDTAEHVVVGGSNARLVEELGLVDYLAGLSTIAGTPEETGQVLRGLAALGITSFLCALPGNADPHGTLHRLADVHARFS
jgi:alkanesulfonate monooxygenase SsuD/methylene tetrahydromethanopterin reductase-like flavin-dependent oxidoreductase (luciferase family)